MIAWLLGTLAATSALMALVLVLREPVRRRFGPAVAYALWLAVATRAVLPPLTTTVERVVPSGPAKALALPASLPPIAQPFDWTPWLVILWLAGAVVLLGRGLSTYRMQRRAILDQAEQLAVIGAIRLIRSECVRGPVAFGLLDRVIAVPLDFDQRFCACERRLALDHELAHHRAGDLLANTIAFVLLCLQWFNPLAWAAHAAFRFDQEAACDARVLDKADAGDRSTYGEAIAKAASGRALLFAGALDRPSTLSRRLKIMTKTSHPARRRFGFLLLGAGLLIGLPLTASQAVRYVEVRSPAPPTRPMPPMRPQATMAAVTPLKPLKPLPQPVRLAALAPVAASQPQPDISFIGSETVRINGVSKRWEELTPAERDRIRRETAKARAQLNEQLRRLPEELAQAQREADRFRSGEFQREMAEAKVNMRNALDDIQRHSAVIRAAGKDPDEMQAEVRRSLAEIERMDIAKVVRESLAAVNPDKIRGDVENASRSLAEVEAKLNQLDGR